MMSELTRDDIDHPLLMDLLPVFLRWWWVLGVVVILITSLGILYAVTTPRVYRVEVLFAPAVEEKSGLSGNGLAEFASQFSGLASLAGVGMGGSGGNKDIALATLTSHGFQSKLVDDLDLMRVFYKDRWDESTHSFRPSWTGAIPSSDDAIEYFNDKVFSLIEDRKMGLMRIRIEWYDRVKAAEWANEIVLRLNRLMRDQATSEARRSLEFLNDELKRNSNIQIQQSIYGLMQSQMSRIMIANVREQFAFRVIDPAVPPAERNSIRPKRSRIVIFAFGISLVLGSVVVVIVESLYGSILRQQRDGIRKATTK